MGQPVDEAQANAAQGARDQVGGSRHNRQGGGALGLANHDLAAVTGLGQEPEGVGHRRNREDLDRNGLVGAPLQVG